MQAKKMGAVARIVSVCCAVVLLFGTATFPVYAETAAEKYQRLKEELAQINQSIEDAKDNKAAAEELRRQYAEQKAIIDELIVINEQEIANTEVALAAKEEEAAAKRQEIYDNDQLYQQRLVAIYEMNNASTLSQLLSVDSFTELMQVMDAMQRISENDTNLLEQLAVQRAALEEQQAQIDADLADLRNTYEELATNQEALANSIAAQNALISQAEQQIAAGESDADVKMEELEQAQAEMRAEAERLAGMGSRAGDGSEYIGGVFTWPVPDSFRITCQFGAPDPNGTPHRGLDIGAPSGCRIVACGTGKVIVAGWHNSYGNYVVIDHGNGIKTLYGHCSSLNVSVGQAVATGDTIAYVGSTGFSTGPHLHLEVQTPGLQNPLGWLRG